MDRQDKERESVSGALGVSRMRTAIYARAKQEKVRLQERVKAGLERARAKGVILSKKGLAPIERKKIIAYAGEHPDLSVRKLAAALMMKPGTVHKTLSLFRSGKCDEEGVLK